MVKKFHFRLSVCVSGTFLCKKEWHFFYASCEYFMIGWWSSYQTGSCQNRGENGNFSVPSRRYPHTSSINGWRQLCFIVTSYVRHRQCTLHGDYRSGSVLRHRVSPEGSQVRRHRSAHHRHRLGHRSYRCAAQFVCLEIIQGSLWIAILCQTNAVP